MSKKLFKISEDRLRLLLNRERLFLGIIFGLRDLDIVNDINDALQHNKVFKEYINSYSDNIDNYVL